MNLVELRELPAWNCDCSIFIPSNGRTLFDFGMLFLKGTGGLIALNCDHNMFILSNGRALFDFDCDFSRWMEMWTP